MRADIQAHLKNTFNSSLPTWVDKTSKILSAIEHSLTELLSDIIKDYEVSSDFILSDKAKLIKQDDYKLMESFDISEQFKNKYRNLFRRGTANGLEELRRILVSNPTKLYYDTVLYEDTQLGDSVTLTVTPSKSLISGWILNTTFPSINSVALNMDVEGELSDYVFSQKDFLLLSVLNKSEMSNEELEDFILSYFMPFSIPTEITFIKN